MINIDLGLIIGIFGALLGIIAWGSKARMKGQLKDAERRTETLERAKEIQRDVQAKPDDDLANEFDRLRAIREKRR